MSPEIYWVKQVEPFRLAIMARPRSGDWLRDEITGWRRANVGTVVSLLEPHEIRELGLSDEAALCEASGIEFLSFPIQDRGAPSSIRDTTVLVEGIVSRLRNDTAVSVHCRAGIGRSGLVAGCVMLKLGVPFSEVFPILSQVRGNSVPDTPVQVKWVEQYGRV